MLSTAVKGDDKLKRVHVVAAVIVNAEGQILISKRHEHAHQGGRWEFPGGKLEDDETVEQGLSRELVEELGITPTVMRPLIQISHDYPGKSVLLDVWRVTEFSGEATGREGQPIKWVSPQSLADYTFPEANVPICAAAQLPDLYAITPQPEDETLFLNELDKVLTLGIKLLQFRAKAMQQDAWSTLAEKVINRCRAAQAICLLNTSSEQAIALQADGLHLDSRQLHSVASRPVPNSMWLAASCHTNEDLSQAQKIGADFVVVSPIKATKSHPEAKPIGWQGLKAFTERAKIPVFALGGMDSSDLEEAHNNGAQGISAIRSLWRN